MNPEAFEVDNAEIEIDVSKVEKKDFSLTPGTYPAVVQNAEKTFSKEGNPMMVLTFLVNDRIKTKSYLVLTPAALWKAENVLTALGLEKTEDGKFKFKTGDIIGRRCLTKTINEEYNGEQRVKVDTVKPHPEGHGKTADRLPF